MSATYRLKLKPVSTNSLYRGRRYKSAVARQFEQDASLLLAATVRDTTLPDGELAMNFRVGTTRRMDVDNCLKLLIDVIATHFGFDDRRVTGISIVRVPVKAGDEFISFNLCRFRSTDFPNLIVTETA